MRTLSTCSAIVGFAIAFWLLGACGSRSSLSLCGDDCASVGGSGGSGGAGAGGAPPVVDAASGVCGSSCGALAELDCASGYDLNACISGCEAARSDPQCGLVFQAAVECLLEHGRAQCAKTGAPQFFDPFGKCAVALNVYADCGASGSGGSGGGGGSGGAPVIDAGP